MARNQSCWVARSKLCEVYCTLPEHGPVWELVRGFENWLLAQVDEDGPVLQIGPSTISEQQAQIMAFHLITREEEREEERARQRELIEIEITRKGKDLWHVTDHNSSSQTDSFLRCMEWASGALSPGGPGVVFKWMKGWTDD